MTLAYVLCWPEFQKYEDMDGFKENSWATHDESGPVYIVDKEWFDRNTEDGEDHSYTGD